jgi:hypothetical protein
MKFESLAQLIFNNMVPKLERNNGLFIFAKERAKFEGWLKVELCESLSKYFSTIIPEKDRIDVVFDNWAVELKTVNTSYKYENVSDKTRPITQNIQEVIEDIQKLKSKAYTNKAVLFVVFPVTHENRNWKEHLEKVQIQLRELKHKEFKFKKEIPGVIYFGLL